MLIGTIDQPMDSGYRQGHQFNWFNWDQGDNRYQWHHRPSVSHKSLNLCDSIGVWKDVDPISGGPVEGQGQSGVYDQLQEIRIPTGWICGRWGFPCRSRRQRAGGMTRPGSWRLPRWKQNNAHRRKTSKPSTDNKKLQLAPLQKCTSIQVMYKPLASGWSIQKLGRSCLWQDIQAWWGGRSRDVTHGYSHSCCHSPPL